MSAYHPSTEAEARVLTAIRNDDYKDWAHHLDAAGITPAHAGRDFAAACYEAVLMRALGNLAFDAEEGAELERLRLALLLSEDEAAEIRQKRGRKAIKALAKHLFTDSILTPAEHTELDALGAELALSKEEIASIIEEVTGKRDGSQ
jgi:hypothetical protein